jgi:hypothetical protein
MPMTLLEVVQEFTDRQGLTSPGSVMSSSDDTIRQIRALLNEVISHIIAKGNAWDKLKKEATFATTAVELQGAMTTIAPFGFKRLILGSAFNRTERVQLYGPRGSRDWQANEALPNPGPYNTYRIWQGNFYLQPAPTAGQTIAFEYASDYAILDVDGVTWKRRFDADTDVFALDEDMLFFGLNWVWNRRKGLSYSQEFDDFENLVASKLSDEPSKAAIDMSDSCPHTGPGVIVPAGSWPL